MLKLADFGSCRSIHSKQPLTEYISTRWYRAPECLLTDGYYGYEMDIWGVGCVFYEIVTLMPLFPGKNEIDQIHKIHEVLGTPSSDMLSRFQKHASSAMDFNFQKTRGIGLEKKIDRTVSKDCLDLMKRMLMYNPEDRITSKQALKHPYFKDQREAERKLRQKRSSVVKMIESQNPNSSLSHSSIRIQGSASSESSASSTHRNGKLLPTVGKKMQNSDQSHSRNDTNTLNSLNGNSTNDSHGQNLHPAVQVLDQGDVSLPALGQFHQAHSQMTHHANKTRKYPYFAKRTLVK